MQCTKNWEHIEYTTAHTEAKRNFQLIRLLNFSWCIIRWAFHKHGVVHVINTVHAFNLIEMLFMHLIIRSAPVKTLSEYVVYWNVGQIHGSAHESITFALGNTYIWMHPRYPFDIHQALYIDSIDAANRNDSEARLKFNWQNNINTLSESIKSLLTVSIYVCVSLTALNRYKRWRIKTCKYKSGMQWLYDVNMANCVHMSSSRSIPSRSIRNQWMSAHWL